MQEIIALIIFTVPGLITYFWINLFGITPSSKKNNGEMAVISILLWIPIICIILAIYNILAFASRWEALHPSFDIPILKKEWSYVDNLTDLMTLSGNIWFILFYTLLTVIVSFFLARFISKDLYKKLIDQVNKVRTNNKIASLGAHSTVWDSMFLNNQGQVVELKREGQEKSIKGFLIRVPRAHETGHAIVLEAVEHWANVMDYYDVEIEQTYVDLDNGVIINVYNLNRALEAQKKFNERFPDGITS
ncbi:hypothetical protein Pryu01_01244 [Paraliobacillus ryukyuensis]|uniref:Uncharacterized protein n=1 Tax=Paraliobacillus ryukyuensis TaxID=200904 RepID=A0A366EB25_9BACI|nr:hypothetical protein [Paraliobacillus ryukyuensis]RBO99522.1 hypothetical protein DES48_104198 [Paraliobacillus ryukyuensis]